MIGVSRPSAPQGSRQPREECHDHGDSATGRRRRRTANETLTITDNRTGKQYELPIEDGTIRATELRKIKTDEDDFGLMTYDPAFMNTASCRSAITFIDGDKGILEYRGYPIEQLAEKSSYLEVAYLLVHGELPTEQQLDDWTHEITIHTFVHENIKEFMQGFRYDAHPMGMLLASVGALSTFYPEASAIKDAAAPLHADHPADREDADARGVLLPPQPRHAVRLSGQRSELRRQLPLDDLQDDRAEVRARPAARARARRPLHPPRRPRAELLDQRRPQRRVLQVDPYSAVAAGVAALYGPLHGGANEEVLRMLRRIETTDNIPDFIKGVKEGNERLMGFGHRVYKNYDPRAKIIKKACDEVFEVTGKNPLLDIAIELEQIALEDELLRRRASSTRTSTSTPG